MWSVRASTMTFGIVRLLTARTTEQTPSTHISSRNVICCTIKPADCATGAPLGPSTSLRIGCPPWASRGARLPHFWYFRNVLRAGSLCLQNVLASVILLYANSRRCTGSIQLNDLTRSVWVFPEKRSLPGNFTGSLVVAHPQCLRISMQ